MSLVCFIAGIDERNLCVAGLEILVASVACQVAGVALHQKSREENAATHCRSVKHA